MGKLALLRDKLINMKRENLVKINHSVMEILCAAKLLSEEYDVDVEHILSDSLVCDVIGEKNRHTTIVEIETGYIPPEHALNPSTYTFARIISKIARYSHYANRLSLGVPAHILLPIPKMILEPPETRDREHVLELKRVCDRYYNRPPVPEESILNAHLCSILIIDIDKRRIEEIRPSQYRDRNSIWNLAEET